MARDEVLPDFNRRWNIALAQQACSTPMLPVAAIGKPLNDPIEVRFCIRNSVHIIVGPTSPSANVRFSFRCNSIVVLQGKAACGPDCVIWKRTEPCPVDFKCRFE